MDYQKNYNSLITTRKNRIIESTKYYEKHHIVPKSMGGDNSFENIVRLTAREHFLAHWLLKRIYPKNKSIIYAFYCMNHYKNKKLQGLERKFLSIAYAEAKEARQSIVIGSKHSEQTIQKMRISAKGRRLSEKFI